LKSHEKGNEPLQEFDGSDSGARPDEAISWGKIKIDAQPVKVNKTCSTTIDIVTHTQNLGSTILSVAK
jgi:deoxyhypusine synthase